MKLFLGAFGAALAIAGTAAAAQPAWSVDVGAAGRMRPAHLGSDQYVFDIVPIVEATYGDRLTISLDDGIKWAAFRDGPVDAGPIAEDRQSLADKLPAGAHKMTDALELGGFAQVKTRVGVVEGRLRRAVNSYQGWSGDLSFSTGAPVSPKLMIGGQARLAWADSNFTQEYFGLKPRAARRFGLPRFLDEDFLTAGAELDAAQQVTPKTHVILALAADRILGELRPSPLFSTRNIFTASIGFTYHWSARTPGSVP